MSARTPPVLSMTGFARVRRETDTAAVTVTLRSVNHRFLDLRWQLPAELEDLQPELEKRLREQLKRGHVDARFACESRGASPAAHLDVATLESYLSAYQEISRRLSVAAPASPADVLRFPGIFTSAAGDHAEDWATLAPAALREALEELQRMRAVEGAALAQDLNARLDELAVAAAAIAAERPALEAGLREKLERRLREWLGGAATLPPERMVQEAALLAERSDISEELTRLDAHLAQARALLAAGGEVGKKLDFLAQELGREVNTLCSKTTAASPAGLRITELGLTL
ncbi:MAG TPA: YicC/YloC family endoribonuclease, partial [Terriglobales bacterium]|nr:YicC/YloC family endoribonuclease [Terriglobales bacterium]